MSLLDTIKAKITQAKGSDLIDNDKADKLVGFAEGLDDGLVFETLKVLFLLIPKPFSLAIFYLLQGLDQWLPEEIEESFYLDELKKVAESHV